MAAPSAEIQFAQRLAANEKTTRDRALKKLRKYIRSRSATTTGFSEDELIKLWKGLHYCMWMQDKPLLQEELAVHITRLIFSFPSLETSLSFFKIFLITEAREWNAIDRLRMDKFMMLVRQMVNQMFVVLKQDGWREESLVQWGAILNSTLLDPDSERIPDSLAMHLADIFLPELTKVGSEQLDADKILSCLKVFDNYLQVGKRPLVLGRILSSVFGTLVDQTAERTQKASREKKEEEDEEKEDDGETAGDSDSGYDEDSQLKLKFDSDQIADHLFKIGSDEKCSGGNRQKVYSVVKRLRDASSGTAEEVVGETEEFDPDDDLDAAVERLNKLHPVKRKKKKKKKEGEEEEGREEEEEESGDKEEGSEEDIEEIEEEIATDANKKKKQNRKRKLDDKSEGQGQKKVKDTVEDAKVAESKKAKVDTNKTNSTESAQTADGQKKKKKRKKKKKKPKTEISGNGTKNTDSNLEMKKADVKGDNSVSKGVKSSKNVDGNQNVVKQTNTPNQSQKSAENTSSTTSNTSSKKSKKKKKRANETQAEELPAKIKKTEETNENSSNSVSKQLFKADESKNKKSESVSKTADNVSKMAPSSSKSDFDKPLEEGETEIWVPSKKYLKKKQKSGETPSQEMDTPKQKVSDTPKQKNAGTPKEKTQTPKQKAENTPKPKSPVHEPAEDPVVKKSDKKRRKQSGGAEFAKFEKVSTPPAFVKKAVAKVSAKTPAKQAESLKKSTPEMTASEKKVKFNMKKNTAQKFEDSMTISPLPAFLPGKSPVQGILKSPATPVNTPASKKKNKKKKLLTPEVKTPKQVLFLSSKTLESVDNVQGNSESTLKSTPLTRKTLKTPKPDKNAELIETPIKTPKSGKKVKKVQETPIDTPKSTKNVSDKQPETPKSAKKVNVATPKSAKKVKVATPKSAKKGNVATPKSAKKTKMATPKSEMAAPKSGSKSSGTQGKRRSLASDFF